jgi:hypothetical protein
MQLSKQTIAAISAVSYAAVGNAAPGPGEVGEWWDINCKHGQPNDIVSSDIGGMAQVLATSTTYGNLRSPYTMPQNSAITFSYNTAFLEVVNKQLLDRSVVEFRYLAGALDAIKNQCCGSFPSCIGSTAIMRSSNFHNLLLIVRRS